MKALEVGEKRVMKWTKIEMETRFSFSSILHLASALSNDSSSVSPRVAIQLFRYLLYQSFLYLISLSDELSYHPVIDIVMKNTLK